MATEEIPVLIPRRRVTELTGLERSALYDRIQRHEFPAPVNVGSSSVRWVLAEVVQWVQARIDAPRGRHNPQGQHEPPAARAQGIHAPLGYVCVPMMIGAWRTERASCSLLRCTDTHGTNRMPQPCLNGAIIVLTINPAIIRVIFARYAAAFAEALNLVPRSGGATKNRSSAIIGR